MCLGVSSANYGQEVPSPLTLQVVLKTALARSPRVQVAEREVDGHRGALLAAGEPFDLRLSTLLSGSHETQLGDVAPPQQIDSLIYGASGTLQLRSGIVLKPEFSLTGATTSVASGIPIGHASVKLGVIVPLRKDRGGAVTVAPERGARHELEASRSRLRQAMADSVLLAARAYWEYVAARERHAILAASEARAARLVEETRVLVQADERTAADLTQLRGNLSAKRAARLGAEIAVTEAWHRLVLAMGLEARTVLHAASPATPFPVVMRDRAAPSLDALVRQAQHHRADFAAATQQVEAARVLLAAARNELEGRLDLVLNSGYTGRQLGGGANRFFAPLFRDISGLDASAQVRYEFLASNAGARGRLLQQSALYETQRIALADLERQIAAEVGVAVEVLQRSSESLSASQDADRLFDEGVQNEERKFRLGMSTLFDVIQAADGLTNARLGEITAQRDYAVAIATLRYQTGTLVRFDEERPIVDAANLLEPPLAGR